MPQTNNVNTEKVVQNPVKNVQQNVALHNGQRKVKKHTKYEYRPKAVQSKISYHIHATYMHMFHVDHVS